MLRSALLLLLTAGECWARDKCDENGFCWKDEDGYRQICGVDQAHCDTKSADEEHKQSSIYRHGGTAQAYKPNVPMNDENSVCDASRYEDMGQKVATWPFTRWTRPSPPRLTLTLQLWVCESGGSSKGQGFFSSGKDCCCQSLSNLQTPEDEEKNIAAGEVTVEAWQARPDGTYSSVRPGNQEGDCRARVVVDPKVSKVVLETMAPGSVGSMGGFVPSPLFDWMPYQPPVLHLLVSAPSVTQVPILVDLPLLFNQNTLEQEEFSLGSIWRGPMYTKNMASTPTAPLPVQIFSWKPSTAENKIDIGVDVFLEPKATGNYGSMSPANNATELFCGALPFGFPASFFLEPIVTCAPSTLDFFDL